jgi:hypothetical protein
MSVDHAALSTIGRRDFTLQAALALLAGVVITIDGCGGSSSTPTSPAPVVGDLQGAITGNHGHVATITGAQITAANALSLDIQGTATHPHTVDLAQADLRSLQSRQPVTKQSTTNSSHQHTVTFTPA